MMIVAVTFFTLGYLTAEYLQDPKGFSERVKRVFDYLKGLFNK